MERGGKNKVGQLGFKAQAQPMGRYQQNRRATDDWSHRHEKEAPTTAIHWKGKSFSEFSGLRSSSGYLPLSKKSSDDFHSVVAFQTSAVKSSGGYRKGVAEAKLKVAINGFGRIGRNFLRCWHGRKDSPLDVIAINDTGGVKQASHLLKYDSTLGIFEADVKPAAATGPSQWTERSSRSSPTATPSTSLEGTGD
ncbi:glyceraldehyde-3-phosphate dehydrogenase GAPA1, chloroplastic-like [Prosopis cineraria]|uniref:glyceraldehyde-3-phosphate dehydrogenase GAPA1, chloroplastic-like n=1 Tax=Prosopis cineraria TaxID=364024 RepID=UPI00240EF31E|nr:glyceraldehyde-3-phosphate dehydrogenase GAPA1, chloroplastic-like [Prosopis cineraria]